MSNPIDTQTAAPETFIGSHLKSQTKLGQNGYRGASSDLPGKHTYMDRDYGLKADPSAQAGDWQTRKVDATPITPAYGMKAAAPAAAFPTSNARSPSTRQMGGHFQRR